MSNFFSSRRLVSLLVVGLIGSALPGCGEESAVGKPNSAAAAFGPTLVIKANAPGLSAEEISALVAAPIEKHLGTLETLPLVEAICTEGRAEFLLHTKAGCNLKQLESIIRDRLASAREALPQIVDDAGLQIQSRTAPLLIVSVYSPEGKFDNNYLSNYVQRELRDQLTRIPGIGEVTVVGTNTLGDSVLVKQYPGIALLLAPTVEARPAEISEALQKRLGELRMELPPGMLLTLPINAANSESSGTNLVLELQLPEGADEQRKLEALKMVSAMLKEFRGLKNLVGFTRNPLESEGNNPCIILSLTTDESQSAEQRAALQRLCDSNQTLRVRQKSFGKPDTAMFRAAINGPEIKAADELAGKLADQLRQAGKYQATQLRSPRAVTPRIMIKLDPGKLAVFSITSAEVSAGLSEILSQSLKADETRGTIALPSSSRLNTPDGLSQLRVKNSAGHEIVLREVASIESVPTKTVVYHVNNQPAVLLALQALGEQNGKDARDQITTAFNAARNAMMLGDEYRLIWLEE